MADSRTEKPFDSDLYKAFFDDATLSDLTIRLSNRTVSVHRIVLCRRSEYFTKLLTGHFRETGAKEFILEEDDADSMVALLRYICGLPFDELFADRRHLLQPHAMVYIVADKYQIKGLKLAVSNNMKRIIDSYYDKNLHIDASKPIIDDFLKTLEIIVANTTTCDSLA